MSGVNVNSRVVSAAGGSIDYVSADGELLLSVPVPAGIVAVRPFLLICPRGASIQPSPDLVLVDPPGGFGVQDYGDGSHESGANPHFRPTPVSEMELQMRQTLRKMQAATDRVEARARALERVERVPDNPLGEEIRQDEKPADDAAKPDEKKPDAAAK